MALLTVEDLQVRYGLIQAIRGVSFEVNEGEVVALIGANGAGKTTIMHSICNLIPKAGGKVTFMDKDITNTPAHKLTYMGVAQVPEGRRIFQELTVAENLRLGAYTRKSKAEINASMEEMYERFPILKERSKQIAGTLSGGEQQMLATTRALMSRPKLLLMDEPSMGLSPLFVNIIFDMIKKVNEEGTTVLLVEQNAKKALSIANRAYVLEIGKMVKTGTGKELLEDDSIRKAYLGG
ncbi:MAG: ABC transporter ATP-binding protein [Clostridia bacterium]|nr:ABC transporter ATP-binding protein [Clostridia bacterium]